MGRCAVFAPSGKTVKISWRTKSGKCFTFNHLLEKTYFETHAAEMLKERHLTKAAFAEQMGVKAQNVNKVFETKNINTLMRASQVLGVSLDFLISGSKVAEACHAPIDGFIEVNGAVHRIRSKEDIEKVLKLL